VAAASAASALAVEGVGNWQAVAVLAVIGGVAEGRSMPVTRSLELSVAFIPVVLAAVLFGPGAGALVALACMAGDRRGPAWRWVWYASSRTTAGVVAGAVALGVADSMGSDATLLDFLVISMCAALAMMCVDFVSNLGIVRLRKTMTAVAGADRRALHAAGGALRLRLLARRNDRAGVLRDSAAGGAPQPQHVRQAAAADRRADRDQRAP
jgi:uncharacterized membrane protein